MLNLAKEIDRLQKGWRAFRFYRQFVRPGNLCFDIGANRGSRAVIFTCLGARTVALEPNENLTRKLKRFPRVTVLNQAVSEQPGRQKMLFNRNDQISSLNPDWRTKWPECPEWYEREVECVTLDQLVTKYGQPDFCKIDVEGFEPTVVAGLTQALPFLSFEVSFDFLQNTKACLDHLMALGKYEFNYAVGDDFYWLASSWATAPEIAALTVQHPSGDVYARLRLK
jgi:FkbM family methyltransferase